MLPGCGVVGRNVFVRARDIWRAGINTASGPRYVVFRFPVSRKGDAAPLVVWPMLPRLFIFGTSFSFCFNHPPRLVRDKAVL